MTEGVSGINKPEDTDRLILMLRKGNYIERMNTLEELKVRKDEKAVVPLIFALNGADGLHRSIIDTLIKMGDMAIGPMLECWPSMYLETQKFLIDILGAMDSEKAIDALIFLLNDEKNQARPDAALALGMIGGKKAVEPLVKALNDDSFAVRVAAYRAINNVDTDDIDLAAIVREVETQCIKMEAETLDTMRRMAERRISEPVTVVVDGVTVSTKKPAMRTLFDQDEDSQARYSESQLSFCIYVWRMTKIVQKKLM